MKAQVSISAYDYYPFGMLMPDRYVSDTSEHCLTVSRPRWSWQWVFVNCYDVYEWPWNGFVVVAKGSATKTGDAVSIDLPEPGDGVSFDMAVTPHAAQQLVLSTKRIDMNSLFGMFRRASRTTDKSRSLIRFIKTSSLIYAGELHLSWYHSVSLYQQFLKYQRIYLA